MVLTRESTMSEIRTAKPGTVSEGTLKAEDLLPKFADALESLIQDNAEHWCGRQDQRDTFVNLVWVLRECDFDHDDVDQYLQDACDALNYFAPAGYSFGAHEGDGADFGFWPCEDN